MGICGIWTRRATIQGHFFLIPYSDLNVFHNTNCDPYCIPNENRSQVVERELPAWYADVLAAVKSAANRRDLLNGRRIGRERNVLSYNTLRSMALYFMAQVHLVYIFSACLVLYRVLR